MSTGSTINVTVVNNLPGTVYLVTPFPCAQQGNWTDTTPRASIAPNGTWGPLTSIGSGASGCLAYTYLSPLGATTTFQFNYGCPGGNSVNSASASAKTPPSVGKPPAPDYTYAVPFETTDSNGKTTFCAVESKGSPLNVTFYLFNRIVSVQPAAPTAPILNWAGTGVNSGPIWTQGTNYNDGNGGSTNPLLFYGPPSTGADVGPKYAWLEAMVMSDQTTVAQNNYVTLHAPMMELITNKQIMFQSDPTKVSQNTTPTSISLYTTQASSFKGLACISSFVSGAANWNMAAKTVVGAPQLEIYWPRVHPLACGWRQAACGCGHCATTSGRWCWPKIQPSPPIRGSQSPRTASRVHRSTPPRAQKPTQRPAANLLATPITSWDITSPLRDSR